MINVHVAVLAVVVVMTLVILARHHNRSDRSLRTVAIAVSPFLLVGMGSRLLLSATGVPIVEWLLPATSVLVLGLFWNSRRGFEVVRWSMILVAVALCVNFTELAHGRYTASPESTKRIAAARQRAMLDLAANSLHRTFGPEVMLPAGPISEILDSGEFTSVDAIPLVQHEWHTPVTRLYRVVPRKTSIWCPGGRVDTASRNLRFQE